MDMTEPPNEKYTIMKVLFHDPTQWKECYVWVKDHKVYVKPTGRQIASTKGWENDLRTRERSRRPKKKIVR